MARLYDDVMANKRLEKLQRDYLRKCTVVSADNVARYLEDSGHAWAGSMFTLPNVAPPLKDMFIEFKMPAPLHAIGWYFQAFDVRDGELPTTGIDAAEYEGARWMLRGFEYMGNDVSQPHMWAQLFVNPDGTMQRTRNGVFMLPTRGGKFEYWLTNPKEAPENAFAPHLFFLTIALWTITFMHTKNVIQEEVPPIAKLSKKHEVRYGEPLVTYRIIKIKPMGGKRTTGEDRGGSHRQHSAHIRRGHFKTYTEDAPLLGRAVGTFWWEQGMYGSEKQGKVTHGYEIGEVTR